MLKTRRIIRAFLASPSDLQDERRAIREVVNEFNDSWANHLGYQVELIGWEETVAGFGRPQNLINRDLDQCDLFLGMLWKRWGTPPDANGDFSSGFEEEFERSITRRRESGSPELSIFFKEIPSEFMADPGQDLKRVINFKNEIIERKEVLYQNFSQIKDIEKLVRKCITEYVNAIKSKDESLEDNEVGPRRTRPSNSKGEAPKKDSENSPISPEGLDFLESFIDRVKSHASAESLSRFDVARLRLLANLVSRSGNEETSLGVHDANIVYAENTDNAPLGRAEKSYLCRIGFQNLSDENTPIWKWYSELHGSKIDPAIASSLIGATDNEKSGAISVLTSMRTDLTLHPSTIGRSEIIQSWLSDDSSTVKISALRYLSKCGNMDDLNYAKAEYDRNDNRTSRIALECMIEILFRSGRIKEARQLLIESQFETIDPDLLEKMLSGLDELDTPTLLLGLEHSNAKVRRSSIRHLLSRNEISIDIAKRLTLDSDAIVRNASISILLQLGSILSEEEIERILVTKQNKTQRTLLGLSLESDQDETGKELFIIHKKNSLKNIPEERLDEMTKTSMVYDDSSYFALCEKNFKKHGNSIRRNVDEKFEGYFYDKVSRITKRFGDNPESRDLESKTIKLGDFIRRTLTRRGLDMLCTMGDITDRERIRSNLRSEYTEISEHDAKYFKKYGEWQDIVLLANGKRKKILITLLTDAEDRDLISDISKTIVSIGRGHPASDFFSLSIPNDILRISIDIYPETAFSRISQEALMNLLSHESEQVRRSSAILTVRAFPIKKLRDILRRYIERPQRYYNVIHWLDLGISMKREDALSVSKFAREWQDSFIR